MGQQMTSDFSHTRRYGWVKGEKTVAIAKDSINRTVLAPVPYSVPYQYGTKYRVGSIH